MTWKLKKKRKRIMTLSAILVNLTLVIKKIGSLNRLFRSGFGLFVLPFKKIKNILKNASIFFIARAPLGSRFSLLVPFVQKVGELDLYPLRFFSYS